MPAQAPTREAKLRRAVQILSALEPEAAERVLSSLAPAQRAWLEQAMQRQRPAPKSRPAPSPAAGQVAARSEAASDAPTSDGFLPFAFLVSVPPEVVARVLAGERPAVAALVLSCAPFRVARAVMAALPEPLAEQVSQRLGELRRPAPGVARRLSDELEAVCQRLAGRANQAVSGVARPKFEQGRGRGATRLVTSPQAGETK